MKRNLLLFSFVFFTFIATSQTPVPNGDFESWTSGSYKLPVGYPISSNPSTFFRYKAPFNVTQLTPGFHGTYAAQLSTTISENSDTIFGYLVPVQPNGSPSSWHGGIPYDQMATGIRGYYKYNIETADSGTILVAFSKAGVNIGTYIFEIGGNHPDFTLFHFDLVPALPEAPDSVIFAAISCKFTAATEEPVAFAEGSLVLDSISFTGVANQPANLNGDFENWENKSVALPDNWIYFGNDQGEGLSKSTDANTGLYALELKTYLGNNDNGLSAQPSMLSNSNYENSCNCQKGGVPFTNQNDTLVFYYKYLASGNDSAIVNLSAQSMGSSFWGTNFYIPPSASYQYAEIPINLGQAPDTLIIFIQSSMWGHEDLSFVGSDLLIDDLNLKSYITSSKVPKVISTEGISVYPNPGNGILYLADPGLKIQKYEIYNLQGKLVYSISYRQAQLSGRIDISSLQKGMYLLKLYTENNTLTQKIVLQ